LGRTFTFCLGQGPRCQLPGNCREVLRNLVSWKVVGGQPQLNAEERQEKRAAEAAPISRYHHSRSTLGKRKKGKKAPQGTRGGRYTLGHNGQGKPWGGKPPSKDTKPRDCPKFRPPASRAALSKSYSSTATAFRLARRRFAYLLVEPPWLRSDRPRREKKKAPALALAGEGMPGPPLSRHPGPSKTTTALALL